MSKLHVKLNSANHFKWDLTEDIDQPILDLLSLTVSNWGGSLSEGTPHLKTWPNSTDHWMGFQWRHRSGNTWSAVTDSFNWGGVHLICTRRLEIWTHLLFYALLHRGLFYERPIRFYPKRYLEIFKLHLQFTILPNKMCIVTLWP